MDDNMERLQNTIRREYDETEMAFDNWMKWERESKIKRMQQLGQIKGWELDEGIKLWLKESEECYIMGFFFASSFFSGATLEFAMTLCAKKWDPPRQFNKFEELIDEYHEREIFNEKETNIAHDLRKIRNYYGHSNIDKLAKLAVENRLKVLNHYITISNEGIKDVPDSPTEIVTEPQTEEMKLIFAHFNSPRSAWIALKNLHRLLFKLYPKVANQESQTLSTSNTFEIYHLEALEHQSQLSQHQFAYRYY
jgi:hypothetical protein